MQRKRYASAGVRYPESGFVNVGCNRAAETPDICLERYAGLEVAGCAVYPYSGQCFAYMAQGLVRAEE